MRTESLRDYLDEHHVHYNVISHVPAYTAQCIAGLTHTPGRELAKSVMVKLDGQMVMAVLPAMYRVDLAALKKAAHARTAELAEEQEFYTWFPECETGAMPPFGNLYGIKVYADESLTRDKEIAFNAGTHRELIRMNWEDFVKLVQPRVIRLAVSATAEWA